MVASEGDESCWRIFVISLADATDRRAALLAQCARAGLDPEIIDAVDGRKGLAPEFEPLVDREAARRRTGRILTDGELACAISHQLIYRRILDEGLPGAIVLEDDAILTPMFPDFLARGGYLEADLIHMDHYHARIHPRTRRQWSDHVALAPLAANPVLATGYSISAGAARFLLDHTTPISGYSDWPCDLMPLGPLATIPRLIDHALEGASALRGDRAAAIALALRSREYRRIAHKGWERYMRLAYWRRWLFKRRTEKIS